MSKSFSVCLSEKPPKIANALWLKYEENNDTYSLYIFNEDKWEILCSQEVLKETLRMLKRLNRAGVVDVREEVEIQLNEKLQNLDIYNINYPALDKSLSELLNEFYTISQNLHPVAFSGYYTDLSKRENVVEKSDLNNISNTDILSIWNLSHII